MSYDVITERICLVCRASPGTNPLGLCDSHFIQYATMCAVGRRHEFVEALDPQELIGRVSQRFQYRTLGFDFLP